MFASRIRNLRASGIREIFDRATAMGDSINLSIGQADFAVPAPLRRAAQSAIEDGCNRYTATGGIPELKEGILRQVQERWGLQAESVLVTSGVSGGATLACLALVEPGDEVLIPDPHFVIYRVLVELCGGIPVFYETYPDFKPRREELEAKISGKTKLIVVNSPQNPTGACYGRGELRMIAAVAEERGVAIVSDEIYSGFVYDGPSLSMLQFHPKALMLSGFSKSFGAPGWRIGYAVGPKEIVEAMEALQQFTYVCAPAPFQEACAGSIDLDVTTYVKEYRGKRDRVYEGLRGHFEVTKPGGAFYMFVKAPWPGRPATDFVHAAAERKVLLVPGCVFSTRDTHFRLSFAAPDEQLDAGVKILRELAQHPPSETNRAVATGAWPERQERRDE